MNSFVRKQLAKRKRRIKRRLRAKIWRRQDGPMFKARNIHYEVAQRARGLSCGGIGAVQLLVRHLELAEAIDQKLHLLKVHLPYHESDHVLNIAYNLLAGGECLEDLELLRNNEVYLDALGAQRIPDPTTAGDFCRRFRAGDVEALMEAINGVRRKVWKRQGSEFFGQARIDADGTIAATTGECKRGMDISYNGQWGYHALVVSLANTREPLYLANRPGNRPSYEQAGEYLDKAIALCRKGGFKSILLRGDTDFTQTARLDDWDARGDVEFIFGVDARANLKARADALDARAWEKLDRPPRYAVKTRERQRPLNVKEEIVRERQFQNIRLISEDVAQFDYRPTLCQKTYRVVVVRKNLSVEKGEQVLFDDIRYFFYITNVRALPAAQIVLLANDRCDQENLIQQLKGGVRAMKMPVDDLVSNWAYLVMASLGWTLKAWIGLMLPAEPGRWQERHRQQGQALVKMEFKGFVNAVINLPAQVVRAGRRILFRLLSWNPWQEALLRGVEAWRRPLRC